ncbi:serine hydrolase [Bombilactobacillus thymidiniphilus]|uniref:Serine hydrolase n=1 Tax=Bombilactobacillus thymidiniphilus TaxID=2923363 RepID=A0ABY4PEB8_9LACO|nr:serine hydrolase [Bombilactobacillus thymidiniphilus]UQS84133.1 serine hydrolase [Bombilactobacillus thymidiniphilus]
MQKKLLKILSSQSLNVDQIYSIISPNITYSDKHKLIDIITSLRRSNGEYKIMSFNEIIGNFSKITIKIIIIFDDNFDFMDKLLLEPIIPSIESFSDFNKAIKQVGNYTVAMSILKNNLPVGNVNSDEKMAVSSVIKMLVAAKVFYLLQLDDITLNTIYTIEDTDISLLSVGLCETNIGERISVKELLSRMLLASDNTAMDILINITSNHNFSDFYKYVGVNNYYVKKSKNLYSTAWNINRDNQYFKMNDHSKHIVWNKGKDYFLTTNEVCKITSFVTKQKWIPWHDIPSTKMLYKGGSSPGVLSAVWSTISQVKPIIFSFAINKNNDFMLIEEIYIYECARKILNLLNII